MVELPVTNYERGIRTIYTSRVLLHFFPTLFMENTGMGSQGAGMSTGSQQGQSGQTGQSGSNSGQFEDDDMKSNRSSESGRDDKSR